MVSVGAKARILKRRVERLALPPGTMEEVARIIHEEGMSLPNAAEMLRVEWLNDLVASEDRAEFGRAARDPREHFIAWARQRARRRYHVTYRAVDAVARRLGATAASQIMDVWPQEIAWAQRLRLDANPLVATKAAMFLREAEGNPGKVFERIADEWTDAFLKADYAEHPAHALSPGEIRFAKDVPEFTPLFLRYAARAYADRLQGMSREKIVALAAVAARDEHNERDVEIGRQCASLARQSPMRRMLPVISAASSAGLSPNELCLLEKAFVSRMERGAERIEAGTGSPHAAFLSAITDPEKRDALLVEAPPRADDEDPEALCWEVVNLTPSWVRELPTSFRHLAGRLEPAMEAWQIAIAEDRREPPIDPVSDFGFFLLKEWVE
jgi:hypothetical protein